MEREEEGGEKTRTDKKNERETEKKGRNGGWREGRRRRGRRIMALFSLLVLSLELLWAKVNKSECCIVPLLRCICVCHPLFYAC